MGLTSRQLEIQQVQPLDGNKSNDSDLEDDRTFSCVRCRRPQHSLERCPGVACADCGSALCAACALVAERCTGCDAPLCVDDACGGSCIDCGGWTCSSCASPVYRDRSTLRRCLSCAVKPAQPTRTFEESTRDLLKDYKVEIKKKFAKPVYRPAYDDEEDLFASTSIVDFKRGHLQKPLFMRDRIAQPAHKMRRVQREEAREEASLVSRSSPQSAPLRVRAGSPAPCTPPLRSRRREGDGEERSRKMALASTPPRTARPLSTASFSAEVDGTKGGNEKAFRPHPESEEQQAANCVIS